MIKKIIFYFLSITVVSSMVFTNYSVFAVNNFYSQNDIQFYDSNAADVVSGCSSFSGTIAEKVWSYFINKGLTKEQTAGIMGNVYQESSISPTDWQTPGGTIDAIKNSRKDAHAWGLFQWDGDRRYLITTDVHGLTTESGVIGKLLTTNNPNLAATAIYLDTKYSGPGAKITGNTTDGFILTDENPLTSKNIPEADLDELLTFELDFAWSEMPGEYNYTLNDKINSLDKIKSTTTVVDATIAFHDYFERSSDSKDFVRYTRGGYAQAIYNKLQNTATSSNTTGCSSGNVFIDAVKKYVWPTFKGWYSASDVSANNTGIDAVTPMPDYKTAVLIAQAAGKYTGDNCPALGVGGGIDCGGFVSTIIRDSGWDPNYNSGGGATGGQMIWLEANWTKLGVGGSFGTETLQPGDVAVNDGHTYVYIGEIEGFTKQVASASRCQRAPMAGTEGLSDSGYTWYRRK